jgi:hypothetical protein
MKGYGPSHNDHPGTPVQLLVGLITMFSWSFATLCGLTSQAYPQSVATHPEEYLRVIMTVFLIMNCIAVYCVGFAVSKSARIIVAGVACQAGYFLLWTLFPRIFHVAPEAILFFSATSLMATLAPVVFGNQDCTDRRAVVIGLFLGLGTASKVTFFPLFLLTLLLRRARPYLVAVSWGVLFMLLFLLPIIDRLKRVFGWLFLIAGHQGAYGGGEAGFIDWGLIPERAAQIAAAEPLLVVALFALTVVFILAKSRERWPAAIMAAAIGLLILLTLKQFSIHYLMPVVAIAPVVVIWAMSRFAMRGYPYILAATLGIVFGVASLRNMSTAFAEERLLHAENENAIQEVLARYPNPVVIGAYRSGYKPWAVQFGLAWADKKFSKLIPGAMADDVMAYDSNVKTLWRSDVGFLDWSYLDRFEKAGRTVLIVQPRLPRIEPQTAHTETLLDQGFGDTVEKIIIAPKPNQN